MCGRFVIFRDFEQIELFFPIDTTAVELRPNYNIAPTHEIPAIVNHGGNNEMVLFHWGLIPFWAKDRSIGYRMINARSETVATKPAFRNAFKARRCLILADGFYEWKKIKGKKQPMLITLSDGSPLAFAGIWETWQPKESELGPIKSCAILTTAACDVLAEIHHRMPVILHKDAWQAWLDPENKDVNGLQRLMAENTLTEFTFHPVSTQVNSVRNNYPELIVEVT